ncbi:SRPBCC family protein [Flavobacterium agrisoli]|uniref:SRPBCC family protein n=1 Tax=Flavobacterium agrisoli TaxID=2793066 RepID=A0A934PN31_9FLAO|nr:SRPBCC family protein [Flavobacterium agrisoli]MBK0370299.1 SRPBCC family protein [Flavobacterium agrisoli]
MIRVHTIINSTLEKVWEFWTQPEHIVKWNAASADWHTTFASNDLKVDGKFKSTMAAKDGSMQFDFEGVYTKVEWQSALEYVMSDGRKVHVFFQETPLGIEITEHFDPEKQNPESMQQQGWQAILDNFKRYTESN